jgi:toxoflavin biosynthesis protein ToxD
MAEVSNSNKSKTKPKNKVKNKNRFFPVIVAGFICTLIAVSGGYGAWYFFSVKANGAEHRQKLAAVVKNTFSANKPIPEIAVAENSKPQENVSPVVSRTVLGAAAEPTPETTPTAEVIKTEKKEETSEAKTPTIEGVVFVKGGETTIGGGKTEKPVQRIIVDDFYIAETEVTNKQYAEFIAETKRKPPTGWNSKGFPNGTGELPVTNVSFADADAYCKWLSKKSGSEVRLPNEAEWERAAKGEENFAYPWGNEWDKKAATTKGKISKVKSYERNKSPFGAYDMCGNVWEWTADAEQNSKGKPLYENGQLLRVLKGGSAEDEPSTLTTSWSHGIAENFKAGIIGFRYIVAKSA